jgi:hypothetical protein
MKRKYSISQMIESLNKCSCTHAKQNYYLFDYYDEVLKDIGSELGIDYSVRIRTLGEIKKILATTKKGKNSL